MKNSFVIAIDGASSTGKSTLAKGLANALSIAHVDSGAMYRGVTLYAQQQHWITETSFDTQALVANLDDIQLMFKGDRLLLNGKDVSDPIRSMSVSEAVSRVAAISEVRVFLVAQQRTIAAHQSVVMDGRDIGTVVFPNADLKIFLTADPKIRAQRRYEELAPLDATLTFEQILDNITQRDHLDSTRADSPLMQAADAIAIVASDYTIEELHAHVLALVKKQIP